MTLRAASHFAWVHSGRQAIVKGVIGSSRPDEDAEIAGQIAMVSSGISAPGPIILRRDGGRPLVLTVIRIPTSLRNGFTPASAIVLITDPDNRPKSSSELLRTLFSMTRVEADLTIALAQGTSLESWAAEHCYTSASSRQLAKQVLAKTGTHRQSELVALVNSYRPAADKAGA